MKPTKPKLKSIFALFAIAFSLFSQVEARAEAGDKGGNGGGDYVLNGKHYLLDLVEAGVHEDPYFSNVPTHPRVKLAVQARLENVVSPEVIELTAQKVSSIVDRYPLLGAVMLHAIEATQIFAPPVELRHPYLEKSPLIYNGQALKRIAVREGQTIYLNTELLKNFDSKNQAALFVHEWTSAVLREKGDSVDTRKIIGAIFHPNGSDFALEEIYMKYGLGPLLEGEKTYRYRYENGDSHSLTFVSKFGKFSNNTRFYLISGEEVDVFAPGRSSIESICNRNIEVSVVVPALTYSLSSGLSATDYLIAATMESFGDRRPKEGRKYCTEQFPVKIRKFVSQLKPVL